MTRNSREYVHPSLRSIVELAVPALPEQPLTVRLTYKGLIHALAERSAPEGFTRTRDLPELSLEQLAAVVRHYPAAFIEAMADYDLELRDLTADTLDEDARPLDRYRLIGVHIAGALRLYVLPLVLRDVQAQCESNRAAEAIERDGHPHDDGMVDESRGARS